MSPGCIIAWSNIGPVCRLQSSQKQLIFQNLSEDDSLNFPLGSEAIFAAW